MKRMICALAAVLALVCLTACGGAENGTANKDGLNRPPVDVDLTAMSKTMAYAQVADMYANPAAYANKTVRALGSFSTYEYGGGRVFSCTVSDSAGCCSLRLDFVPADGLSYPRDYPAEGTEITVFGTFRSRTENGSVFCELLGSQMSE